MIDHIQNNDLKINVRIFEIESKYNHKMQICKPSTKRLHTQVCLEDKFCQKEFFRRII